MIRSRATFRSLVASIVIMLIIATIPTHAGARKRKVGLKIGEDALYTTFSYKDAFTKSILKKLDSGLPTKMVVQVVLESKKGKSITYWARSIEIVYDLWEEHFAITVQDNRGRRSTKVKTAAEAVRIAGILWHAQVVANISGLKHGVYRLRVLVEVNPVSEEMVRNIQRWISKPRGGHGNMEARSNFFGSFVGHFVDRGIGKADKTVSFRSQWFTLGEQGAK